MRRLIQIVNNNLIKTNNNKNDSNSIIINSFYDSIKDSVIDNISNRLPAIGFLKKFCDTYNDNMFKENIEHELKTMTSRVDSIEYKKIIENKPILNYELIKCKDKFSYDREKYKIIHINNGCLQNWYDKFINSENNYQTIKTYKQEIDEGIEISKRITLVNYDEDINSILNVEDERYVIEDIDKVISTRREIYDKAKNLTTKILQTKKFHIDDFQDLSKLTNGHMDISDKTKELFTKLQYDKNIHRYIIEDVSKIFIGEIGKSKTVRAIPYYKAVHTSDVDGQLIISNKYGNPIFNLKIKYFEFIENKEHIDYKIGYLDKGEEVCLHISTIVNLNGKYDSYTDSFLRENSYIKDLGILNRSELIEIVVEYEDIYKNIYIEKIPILCSWSGDIITTELGSYIEFKYDLTLEDNYYISNNKEENKYIKNKNIDKLLDELYDKINDFNFEDYVFFKNQNKLIDYMEVEYVNNTLLAINIIYNNLFEPAELYWYTLYNLGIAKKCLKKMNKNSIIISNKLKEISELLDNDKLLDCYEKPIKTIRKKVENIKESLILLECINYYIVNNKNLTLDMMNGDFNDEDNEIEFDIRYMGYVPVCSIMDDRSINNVNWTYMMKLYRSLSIYRDEALDIIKTIKINSN